MKVNEWIDATFERVGEEDRRYWHRASDLLAEFKSTISEEDKWKNRTNNVLFARELIAAGLHKKSMTNDFIAGVWNAEERWWQNGPRKSGSYWMGLKRKV